MQAKKVKLYAPMEYWKLTDKQRAGICNGCGAESTWWVPDTIWFMDITPACNIHDYMYAMGDDETDRAEADRVFLNNIIRLIVAKTRSPILSWLRRRRAQVYYGVVRLFGGVAFWAHKNDTDNMQEVTV